MVADAFTICSDAAGARSGSSAGARNARAALFLAFTLATVLIGAKSEEVEAGGRPFTVRDSIEMTRVVDFPHTGSKATALFSPDAEKFLIKTQRGDLERNANVETLLLFRSSAVRDFLSGRVKGERPISRVLVQRIAAFSEGPDIWAGISSVRWMSDSEIGFIAQGENGCSQAFTANAETGAIIQLTHWETDVVAFDVTRDTIVFWARANPLLPDVVTVGERSLFELIQPEDPPSFPLVDLFQQSRSTGNVQRVDAATVRLGGPWLRIWISPSSEYAITFAPSVNAPAQWQEYSIRHDSLLSYYAYTPDKVSADPTSLVLRWRNRYQLIDLRKNTAHPLLDAPTGVGAYTGMGGNQTPFEVFWPKDNRSVIVSNTYLPLAVTGHEERERRRTAPAIAEITLGSGAVTPIAWIPTQNEGKGRARALQGRVISVDWEINISAVTVTSQSSTGATTRTKYSKHGPAWRSAPVRSGRTSNSGTLQIQRKEGLNERPRVYATGGACNCTKEFLDPAPNADEFEFASVRIFEWVDANAISWRGGLVLPPKYVPGRRYPLVVQTHGFDPNEFLIDGPRGYTTAMAAQPLASAGIVVLQVEDNHQAMTLDSREASLFAEGYRKAIESLDAAGIVDPSKVGLIAFSRTGLPTIRLLADNPDLLAAVTIADAAWWGYMLNLLLTNASFADNIRDVTEGSPGEGRLIEWIERNPVYRLSQSSAAFRIEANGSGGPIPLLGHWEHFSLLRNAHRPVDFIFFPYGSHVLVKPSERLASQGGNVDWFRFWLQDYEDPDPAKAEQYARWRRLRAGTQVSAQSQSPRSRMSTRNRFQGIDGSQK